MELLPDPQKYIKIYKNSRSTAPGGRYVIKKHLSPGLREVTIALADEVHRPHADKSLTEEMDRVLGGPVPLRMYTGTSTERCLRLFGNREERQGMDILRPN